MKLVLAILCIALASCAHDPMAGKIAAKMTDQPRYVAYERKGKPESVAVFPFAGVYWTYDEKEGSRATKISADRPAPLLVNDARDVSNARWEPVGNCQIRRIENGCLPSAIMKQRLYGGRVVRVSETHVEHVR